MTRGRLALAGLVVVLAVFAVHGTARTTASGAGATETPSPSAAASTAAPSPTPVPSSVSPSVSPAPAKASPASSASSSAGPAAAAERFVAAWLDTRGGKAAWLARLRPLVAGQLYDGLDTTDVTNVPVGKIQPGASPAATPDPSDAIVIVPTTIGKLQVAMARQSGQWVATSIDRAVA